jgi:hypothetical protein
VSYQVYQLTRSSLDLGLVSLAQLFPLIAGSPLGGSVAGTADRHRLLMVAQVLMADCAHGRLCSWSTAGRPGWPRSSSHRRPPVAEAARLLPGFRQQRTSAEFPRLSAAPQSGHETSHSSRGFRTPPTMLKADLEHSWRWRESNPRPSVHHQGFSGRSLLCFSQPRRSRKQDADRLSRCSMFRLAPRPGQAVILLADARHRVEGIPGLTDPTLP